MSGFQNDLITKVSCRNADTKITLVSYTGDKNIHLQDSKISQFYDEYCNGVYSSARCFLGEDISTMKYFPLIGNFVIKFDDKIREVYFDEELLDVIAEIYHRLFREYFANFDNKFDRCAILYNEDAQITPNGNIIRMRFYFPFFRIQREFYFEKFRSILVEALRLADLDKYFREGSPIGDWDEWLSDYTTSVPLFGSFEAGLDPVRCVKFYSNDNWFKPRKSQFVIDGHINATYFKKDEEALYYPILFSVHYNTGEKIIVVHNDSEDEDDEDVSDIDYEDDEKIASKNPKIVINYLLPMISKIKFKDRHTFLDIGRAINNTYYSSEEGLELWKKYTRKNGCDDEECEDLYYELGDSPITHRTIAFYARQDNPEMYNKWHTKWYKAAINDALDADQDCIAAAIYRFFWLEYICDPESKYEWYRFDGVSLKGIRKDNLELREDIMMKFVGETGAKGILRTFTEHARTQSGNSGLSKKDQRDFDREAEKLYLLCKKMSQDSFIKSVMACCRRHFKISDVSGWLDNDEMKMATKNFVLEVCGDKIVPRGGKPEDYITKNTGNRYRKEWNENSQWVRKLTKIYKQMMVNDEELFRYFMRFNASILRGRNTDKIAPICTGEGDNGKSVYVRILQAAYGKLCVQFPVEVISARAGTTQGGARPEIAQAAGARVAVTSEPDEGKMKTNTYKSMTGDDPIFVRSLFQEGGLMMQFYKFLLMCNKVPELTEYDQAIKNRIVIIPFLAKFVDNAPEDEDEQQRERTYPKDDSLTNYSTKLGEAHLWLSVKFFPEYIKYGMKYQPPIVIKATKDHWKDTDIYLSFIKEKMEKVNPEISVEKSEVFSSFKAWHRINYNRMPTDSINDFCKKMKHKEKLGAFNEDDVRWSGWRLKQKEDENSILASASS